MTVPGQDVDIFRKILKEEKLDGTQREREYRLRIYDELCKGEDMDIDLIDGYIRLSFLIEGQEYVDDINVKEEIKKAKKRAIASRPLYTRILESKLAKLAITVCCIALLIVGANIILVQATGNGISDYVVEFGRNYIGFIFMNTDKDASSDALAENTTLDATMRTECTGYGLSPLLPSKLPKDFEQTNFQKSETSVAKSVNFVLGSQGNTIVLDICYYADTAYLPDIKTPDASDMAKIDSNGVDIYLVEQGNSNTAIFYTDHYVYELSSSLGRNETEDILNSFK